MTGGCEYIYPNSASKILARFKERLVYLQREERLKTRMQVVDSVKELLASVLTQEQLEEMMGTSKGDKPIGSIKDVVLSTANLLNEVLQISENINETTEEEFMKKLKKIKIKQPPPSSQNHVMSIVKDQDETKQTNETKMDCPKPNENDPKVNFGKKFARGDHPSRSGATYCAVGERPQRQPKRWNGPGMKMLPPLYGESLHHHKKFVDVSEDWEMEKEYSFEEHDDTVSTTTNCTGSKTFLQSVPLYVPKENEQEYTEQEEKLTAVSKKYQICEWSTSVNEKTVLWFSFQRPGAEKKQTFFLVILNGSYYIWYDWLIGEFTGDRKLDFLLLRNPANCEDVKSKLSSMVEKRLDDLILATLSNFGKLWDIDPDLAAVLEVFHYSWKNPQFKIKFVK